MGPTSFRRRSLILLAVLAAVTLGLQLIQSWEIVRILTRPETVSQFAFSVDSDTLTVDRPGANLLAGDQLRSINGNPIRGLSDLLRPLGIYAPGTPVNFVVDRGGQTVAVEVPVSMGTGGAFSGSQRAVLLAAVLITTWVSLLLGLFVTWRRPGDRLAWLLLGLLLGFSQMSGGDLFQILQWPKPIGLLGVSCRVLAGATWPIWMLWFGLDFPDPKSPRKIGAFLRWPFTMTLLLVALVRTVAVFGKALDVRQFQFWIDLAGRLGQAGFWLNAVAIGFFFANIGYKTGTETSPDARRRLRLLLWGAYVGLTPLFLLLLAALPNHAGDFTAFPVWLWIPALALLSIFPLTLAYVIVVESAMDVGVVVRQGLQYAFATQFLTYLRIALSVFVVILALNLESRKDVPLWIRYGGILLGVGVILGLRHGAEKVRSWLDRRFFREAVSTEQVLSELSDHVRTIAGLDPLLKTVTQVLSTTLHVPQVAALVKQQGSFVPVHCHGLNGAALTIAFPESSPAIRKLALSRGHLRTAWQDPNSWVNRDLSLGEDFRKLQSLNSHLLLPVSARGELLGFLSLGPKLSEEPYSPSDIRLLESVAAQTALAIENNRLTEVVAHEAAQRERLQRELEIAREVQERLFPQNAPAVPGASYYGRCQPAQSVGGDYYDYFLSADGRLFLAVGDIAGKGIPASLLMASLQASLRGLILGGTTELGELMTKLNTLIHAATPRNRFATLFVAQYDPATRRLEYASAGHNPPVLVRANGDTLFLNTKGLALGLTRVARYQQAALTLQPQDVLAIYSDGISEAMNLQQEEFGEQRLVETLRTSPSLETVFASVQHHAGGAPQHDDMTLILLQVEQHTG